jgi:alkanesulfonate monooxygenase SsuD/methylene tetrahydromethanopterin reductase-like flavin-dependent oxidoreductase (luciferase family)
MKLSLMTLGDVVADPVTGLAPTAAERHRAIVEAAVVADEAGFEGVHIGEHHGLEYTTSAPPVILAAIGERTSRLRLSTAVTLAANLDPIRVAEDYATVDALSGGRCEVVVAGATSSCPPTRSLGSGWRTPTSCSRRTSNC